MVIATVEVHKCGTYMRRSFSDAGDREGVLSRMKGTCKDTHVWQVTVGGTRQQGVLY